MNNFIEKENTLNANYIFNQNTEKSTRLLNLLKDTKMSII
jgi:hypothetical protein